MFKRLFINTYTGTLKSREEMNLVYDNNPTKAKFAIQKIVEHIHYVLADGKFERTHFILSYLAHMFQYPEKKPGVLLMFYGDQGTGKSGLFERLGYAWGHHFTHIRSQTDVESRFTPPGLEHAMMVLLDEVSFSHEQIEKWKNMITCETMTFELKGENQRNVSSFMRLFATMNLTQKKNKAYYAEASDRRVFLCRVKEKTPQMNYEYFHELFTIALEHNDHEGLWCFIAWLLRKWVDPNFDFQRKRPITEELIMHQQQCLMDTERFWVDVLKSKCFKPTFIHQEYMFKKGKKVYASDLVSYYIEWKKADDENVKNPRMSELRLVNETKSFIKWEKEVSDQNKKMYQYVYIMEDDDGSASQARFNVHFNQKPTENIIFKKMPPISYNSPFFFDFHSQEAIIQLFEDSKTDTTSFSSQSQKDDEIEIEIDLD
jgi:hypothetical protein